MADPQQTLKTQHRQAFDQITRWYQAKKWQPFEFQIQAWQAYLQGHSGLIHAPTGIGKTYAAFLGPLIAELTARNNSNTAGSRPKTEYKCDNSPKRVTPLKVLWITPLRALAADIHQALHEPLTHLEFNWTVETRSDSLIVR